MKFLRLTNLNLIILLNRDIVATVAFSIIIIIITIAIIIIFISFSFSFLFPGIRLDGHIFTLSVF